LARRKIEWIHGQNQQLMWIPSNGIRDNL
jgi:hypothetical protein